MEITNKTTKPLRITLPGGKTLFLSPGKSGQITRKAAERPAVVKMVEAGDVELSEDGAQRKGGGRSSGGSSGSGASGGSRHGGSSAMRQSGDK